MDFENNDAVNGNGPVNAAAPPQETTTVPGSTTLTSPAPPASAPARPPMQPAEPPHPNRPTASLAESIRHALIGSVLGVAAKGVKAVAGPQPKQYTTDENGRVIPVPKQPSDTTASRLQRIAQSALLGLSAASQMPPQKSRGAAWASGIGAGAEANIGQAQQQDLLKRKQAQEDYDEQQRTLLHKASVAATNAQTHALWQKFGDDENARDTERQRNMGIVNELNDYVAQNPTSGLTVQTLTEAQALAMRDADSHSIAKHTFLPVGKVQAKDAQGNDVFEQDGVTPKWVKQFAAIGGSADEKMPMPAALLDDAKKYAKYDPRLKGAAQLTAGQEMPLTAVLSAYKLVSENKGKEVDGGREGEPVTVNGKLQKRNKFTGEVSEYVGGVPLSVQKEQADITEKESAAEKNRAEAAKAKQETNVIPPASAGLHGEEYLATLPSGTSATLRAIGEGRQTLSPRQLASSQGRILAEQLHQAYPDFDETRAKTWQKANNEYRGSGKTATQIVPAYNTALEHMQDLYTNTTGEGILNPLSKAYQDRDVALGYVAREVGKAVSAGAMTQKEGEDLLDTLKGGLTPGLKRERITKTAQLLHDKIDEYQTKFNESAPSSAIKVPTLISPRAAQSYDFVTGKIQNQPQTSQAPQNQFPAGATHIVPGPDGKMHYTNADGTKDLGVAQ